MDTELLRTALEAHEASDHWIDAIQTIGIVVCASGIIVSCLALLFVANLLRVAAKVLTKDMRTIIEQLAVNSSRIDDLEAELHASRSAESPDARRREGA
jgi:hypothetical protein